MLWSVSREMHDRRAFKCGPVHRACQPGSYHIQRSKILDLRSSFYVALSRCLCLLERLAIIRIERELAESIELV